MVNLILQFLAKNPNSGISVLKDIFKELIDFLNKSIDIQRNTWQFEESSIFLKNPSIDKSDVPGKTARGSLATVWNCHKDSEEAN